jgi:hypothetical protein
MIKKVLYACLFLMTIIASGQTTISGGINQDTNWTLQNSPYILTGDTVIFGSNTLTIEPGVVVKFDSNVQLRIQGSLIAVGNSTDIITFTSNESNPQPGSWREVNLEYNATCILDYVQMEYADTALRYNQINTASSIKNAIFQFNNNAIKVNGGSVQFPITMDTVTFKSNDKGIANFYEEVTLTNCMFINNRIGAELTESNINSCTFEGNSEIGLTGNTSTIQNNTFIFNNIGLQQSFSGGSEASSMTNNTIKNNSIGLKITGNNPVATFSNNTVCNNTIYNVENTSTYSGQDVSNNCWCTNDLNEIENSIYHGLDNINVGVVTFTPTTTGCPDTTTLGLTVYGEIDSTVIYPNPVIDMLNFVNDSKKTYKIYSINGVLIKKGITTSSLNISNLNSGLYFITLKDVHQPNTTTLKFLKK